MAGPAGAASRVLAQPVDRAKPLDLIGKRLAFLRHVVHLGGMASHAGGNLVERFGDGPQLLDSIHVCTNADPSIGMHADERGNPGGSPHF